jgi:hypothetical protein
VKPPTRNDSVGPFFQSQAQTVDRHRVRDRVAEQFDVDRIVDSIVAALHTASETMSWFADVRPAPWERELPAV